MRLPEVKTFPYFGGKQRHIQFILQHLPRPSNQLQHFVDAFGGSAVVILNVHFRLRTYNDLNNDIVNFFRTLRDHPNELVNEIEQTPYARTEYIDSLEPVPANYHRNHNIERARRYAVTLLQGIDNLPSGSRGWQRDLQKFGSYKFMKWTNKLPRRLASIACHLRQMQIECKDAIQLIQDADNNNCTIYLDPPYPHTTRNNTKAYGIYEMSDEQQNRLIETARALKNAHCAISSYPNPLYDSLGWQRTDHRTNAQTTTTPRTETLYTNYQPPNTLFTTNNLTIQTDKR